MNKIPRKSPHTQGARRTRSLRILSLLLACVLLAGLCSCRASQTTQPAASGSTATGTQTTSTASAAPTAAATPSATQTTGDLVEYTGPIYHVFYHYLIAYPDLAVSSGEMKYMKDYCVTPLEYQRSLEQLYANDYILVDINDTYVKTDDGFAVATMMLPEGKKPLIMSFDDVNFYQSKHGKGIVDKIILDENGELAAYTKHADGTEEISYDNEVIPMLETFCKEHPDFSLNGAKGTLAQTGYDGILGYRIQKGSETRESELEAVKPVVAKLKENGWNFASHGYSHLHSDKVSYEELAEDTSLWTEYILPALGDTAIYIYPFGEEVPVDGQKFQMLKDYGFEVFCGTGLKQYMYARSTYVYMDRAYIDGNSLTIDSMKEKISIYVDADTVYDAAGRNGTVTHR